MYIVLIIFMLSIHIYADLHFSEFNLMLHMTLIRFLCSLFYNNVVFILEI
jgi:hypothetical protein